MDTSSCSKALLLVASLIACAACGPTDDQRCSDIDQTLAAKGAQLSRSCEQDDDCLLIDGIHPERPIAANSSPEADAELLDLRTRRIELCGEYPAPVAFYKALCVERECTARATISIRTDAGGAASTDIGFRDDSGGGGEDTGAEDDTGVEDTGGGQDTGEGGICFDACTNVDECGLLLELGLGVSVANCVSLCEADVEANGTALAECLSGARCGGVRDCF